MIKEDIPNLELTEKLFTSINSPNIKWNSNLPRTISYSTQDGARHILKGKFSSTELYIPFKMANTFIFMHQSIILWF